MNSRLLGLNIRENVMISYMKTGRSNDVFANLKDDHNGGQVGVIVFRTLVSFVKPFAMKLSKVSLSLLNF